VFQDHPAVSALPSLALAGVLLTVLTTGITLALRRGTAADCACFGAGRPLTRAHLARNIFLLLVAVAGLVGLLVGSSTAAEPAGIVLALVVGAVVGVIVTRLDDLIDLFNVAGQSARPSTPRS
jgi:Methylamine utilisation protein MauE